MIYTVGDSHCWHTWCKIPGVTYNLLGAVTMFSFGRDKRIVTDGIPNEAILCMCFGEIDCRCHIHKYQPWKETIDKLVENYFDAVRENAKTHPNIWIYNVVPPVKNAAFKNEMYPFVGTDEERLSYVKYMNDKLSKTEFTFVDICDKYSDEEGYLKAEYSDNHVHIEDERFLIEWIDKKLGADKWS